MFSDGEAVTCDLPNSILHISPPGQTQERDDCKAFLTSLSVSSVQLVLLQSFVTMGLPPLCQ